MVVPVELEDQTPPAAAALLMAELEEGLVKPVVATRVVELDLPVW
jgi:hypothetical protein